MQITRKSPFSGEINTKEIDCTREQYNAWETGTLLQNAFPHLSADDREFIKTGITATEWKEAFGDT